MYFWFNRSKKEVENHMMEYLRLINTDGKEHQEDIKKLIEVAEKNGMKGSEIKSMIADVESHKIIHPQNDSERFDHLFYLVNLLFAADYLLNDGERDFLKEMAMIIGFPPAKVPSILREMMEGIKLEKPEPEVKSAVLAMLS